MARRTLRTERAMNEPRIALVTGAASGLARGICVDLAAHNYRVAVNYRSSADAARETLARTNAARSDDHALFQADVSDPSQAERLVHAVEQRYGRLDVLVNVAGDIVVKPFGRTTLEEYRAVVDGNLTSTFACTHAALPGMIERRFGRIICFGMNGSSTTLAARNMSAYAAAKAGVVALAKCVAIEAAPYNVTCNVIEPGDIREGKDLDIAAAAQLAKPRNPTLHAGSWQDIAYAVRCLVGDESGYITAQVLAISGGLQEPYEG
ncbi:SDR family oxidoreductase [bacterium]|nr:MAG: SDR family oxidoreductase [bacterium]